MKTIDQMENYLRYYTLGFRYQDLDKYVIDNDNCCFCGLCVSICATNVIGLKENKEIYLENPTECSECSLCLKYCARSFYPNEVFDSELFGTKSTKHETLGTYQKLTLAKTKDKDIAKVAQNGGVITTLLIYALEKGIIDGVLLTGKDENWSPIPLVARTKEEILDAAGSLYTMVPSLISYKKAVEEYKLKKLAVVAMPCQIQAIRKLQLCNPLSDEYGEIVLILGLLCSSNFSYDKLIKKIDEKFGLKMSDVAKFDIGRGKFFVYPKDGEVKSFPVKETTALKWGSCLHCIDYAANYADISAGSVGASKDDENSIFIRTDVGAKLFDAAVKAKKIDVIDGVDITKLESNAGRKVKFVKKLETDLMEIDDFIKFMDLMLSE